MGCVSAKSASSSTGVSNCTDFGLIYSFILHSFFHRHIFRIELSDRNNHKSIGEYLLFGMHAQESLDKSNRRSNLL